MAVREHVPRGGFRQQLAAPRNRSRSATPLSRKGLVLPSMTGPPPGPLSLSMLWDWGLGLLSGPHLKRHMASSLAEGSTQSNTAVLASIGGGTYHPNNCHRSLINLVKATPLGKLVTHVEGQHITACIQPHHLLHYYYKHFERSITISLGLCEVKCRKFWDGMWESEMGKELFREHPDLTGKTPPQLARSVPMAIHEDAGPYTKRKSMNVISVSSLLGVGTERKTKFPFAAHTKLAGTRVPTDDPAHALLIQSLGFLAAGVVPVPSPVRVPPEPPWEPNSLNEELAGKPIMGNWSGISLFGKVDMEAATVGWGFPSYNAVEMCGWCRANRTDKPFTNLLDNAEWRAHLVRTTAEIVARLTRPLHPLTQAKFFNRFFVRIDIMHALDHRGVSSYVAAGVLYPLVKSEHGLGNTQEVRLRALNHRYSVWASKTKVSSIMPPILLSNLTVSQSGKHIVQLHGPTVKAANTRDMMPWIAELASEFFAGTSLEHSSMRKVTGALVECYSILYGADMFLTGTEKYGFKAAVERFGRHYQHLRHLKLAEAEAKQGGYVGGVGGTKKNPAQPWEYICCIYIIYTPPVYI